MSRFWNPDLQNLSPYVPGEQPKLEKLVKLNTNESPYGPSPKALAAIAQANNDNLRLYPDPDAKDLKEVIAKHHGITSNKVFVGNGSDEVLAQLAVHQQAKQLFDELKAALALPQFDTLSMGMSADLEAAVQAGSTLVRVGTAVFGSR